MISDRPLRIWVAGCSSGEETYSLAMLFREQIDVSKRDVKLQVFASDVDPDAVAIARDGLYPAIDRGRRLAESIGGVFHQGGSFLPGVARAARQRGVHGAGRAGGPAVRASRLRFVPQPSDLPAPRSASEGRRGLPFCLARRRPLASRQCGSHRRRRWPVRRRLQTRAPLSTRWRQPVRRPRLVAQRRRRSADAHALPDQPRRRRAKPSLPSFAEEWCWRPTVRPRC